MGQPRLALALAITLGACSSGRDEAALAGPDAGAALPELPWEHVDVPSLPPRDEVLEQRAELGRLLFYDPVLSADRETACASCHSEIWGMSDGLALSVGHGSGLLSGPGRRGGATLRRNAQQLWNLAFRKTFFWDGRSSSLEEQALVPLRDDKEMGRAPEDSVRELAENDGYVRLFAAAFPDDPAPSVANLAAALAEFQRGLVSARSLYDSYAAGDRYALTDDQVEGMFRFAAFGCTDCHPPPLFASEGFHDRRLPSAADSDDLGRFEVTKDPADRRAFHVPSLRNVAFSSPYFHDGSARTLEDAVRHELGQSGRPFDDEDIRLVESFVSRALVDERLEPDRPNEVPSGLPVPVDGTFVERF